MQAKVEALARANEGLSRDLDRTKALLGQRGKEGTLGSVTERQR
jgi:hypothetical protein